MKKNIIKIISVIVIFICLAIVIRYVSSVMVSTKKYNDLKKEVVVNEPNLVEETKSKIMETQNVIVESTTKSETTAPIETVLLETTLAETIDSTETIEESIDSYISLDKFIDHVPALEIDHATLNAMNGDYKGWLNIPNTKISYPVPQGPDNEFYLHKLFENKQYEYAGSLFIDAYSAKMINQDNLIIYGHNMKNGSMFGTLKQFKSKAFFDSHPYIEFYTPDEKRVYLIFAVRTVAANINSLDYALEGFDAQDYINQAILTSEQCRLIDINKNGFENSQYKQIITLSTCVGDTSKRLIVNGIRIK